MLDLVNPKYFDEQNSGMMKKGYTRNNQLNPHGANIYLPVF